MELVLKNIEKRLCIDEEIIQRTLGTKLRIDEAKIIAKYVQWKKF